MSISTVRSCIARNGGCSKVRVRVSSYGDHDLRPRLLILAAVVLWASAVHGQSFGYVLQADKLAKGRESFVTKVAGCNRDIVVLDPSYDGSQKGSWRPRDVERMRGGKQRLLLAYLSIGEAETYRAYWRKQWAAGKGRVASGAPKWLLEENREWKGNYRVRYWQESWQKLILGMLEEIQQQGFDGVYLDIVDGYEFFEHDERTGKWQDNRVNPETGRSYRRDMVLWVQKLAQVARQRRPGFKIFVQNATALLQDDDYQGIPDGIGAEDVLSDGKRMLRGKEQQETLELLKKAGQRGMYTVLIEYSNKMGLKTKVRQEAKHWKMRMLQTDRELTTWGEFFE